MKIKILLSLFIFLGTLSDIWGNCPDTSNCMEIFQHVNLNIEQISASDGGDGCIYLMTIEGLEEFDPGCFNFTRSANPPLTIEPANGPFVFTMSPDHSSNAPVNYDINVVISMDGLPQCTYQVTENVDLQCCLYNDTTYVDITTALIDCNTMEEEQHCLYEFSLETMNLTGVTIDWDIVSGPCPAVFSFTGNETIQVELPMCDFPYEIRVTVTDEFGCEYTSSETVMCTTESCGVPSPCAGVTAPPPISVDLNQLSCFEDQGTGVSHCTYEFSVINPPAGYSFYWHLYSKGLSANIQGGGSGPVFQVNITNADSVYTVTLVVIDDATNCVADILEYQISCPDVAGNCTSIPCAGSNPLVSPDIVSVLVDSTCTCDDDGNGNITGFLATCTFEISVNSTIPYDHASIDIIYSEQQGVVTQNFQNPMILERSCGYGTLENEACGAGFCISLYDSNDCLIGVSCSSVLCDPEGCAQACNYGGLRNAQNTFKKELTVHSFKKQTVVFPNPLELSKDNSLNLRQIQLDENQSALIDLIDLTGKSFRRVEVHSSNASIELGGMPAGTYSSGF